MSPLLYLCEHFFLIIAYFFAIESINLLVFENAPEAAYTGFLIALAGILLAGNVNEIRRDTK